MLGIIKFYAGYYRIKLQKLQNPRIPDDKIKVIWIIKAIYT